MEWIPPLNGIAMCQNGEVSPSNEEGIERYNRTVRGETLMGRWKTAVGQKLKARNSESQKTEVKIGVYILTVSYTHLTLPTTPYV